MKIKKWVKKLMLVLFSATVALVPVYNLAWLPKPTVAENGQVFKHEIQFTGYSGYFSPYTNFFSGETPYYLLQHFLVDAVNIDSGPLNSAEFQKETPTAEIEKIVTDSINDFNSRLTTDYLENLDRDSLIDVKLTLKPKNLPDYCAYIGPLSDNYRNCIKPTPSVSFTASKYIYPALRAVAESTTFLVPKTDGPPTLSIGYLWHYRYSAEISFSAWTPPVFDGVNGVIPEGFEGIKKIAALAGGSVRARLNLSEDRLSRLYLENKELYDLEIKRHNDSLDIAGFMKWNGKTFNLSDFKAIWEYVMEEIEEVKKQIKKEDEERIRHYERLVEEAKRRYDQFQCGGAFALSAMASGIAIPQPFGPLISLFLSVAGLGVCSEI